MYLKSIEVQGFKSFANKIIFDFHNGITGIVGPNGSGKSNVADAVRWVLGEQRIKQLRGDNMQDVIFSGTETRRSLSYAFVAITLDNSDHQLAIEYEEVTVARKIYRSGESEYLINGTQCRLKDVQELFYDTGIGKEGYSIIGQGQIDKILSGKPEERRELFDEAAGIVKFKRRKNMSIKKLESERLNLVRVNDILSELEKQVGPLEKQAETAKVYLKKKEELKAYDINMFLLESSRLKEEIKEIEQKVTNTTAELGSATTQYEETKLAYQAIEDESDEVEVAIESAKQQLNKTTLLKQQLVGQIDVLKEQINTVRMNDEHYGSRLQTIQEELNVRLEQKASFSKEQTSLQESNEKLKREEESKTAILKEVQTRILAATASIEEQKSSVIELLNVRASTRAKMQHFNTMLEQITVNQSSMNQRLVSVKSDAAEQEAQLEIHHKALTRISDEIAGYETQMKTEEEKIQLLQETLTKQSAQLRIGQTAYHREQSRLDSLKNITERYDGYGNSIRKVMEKKEVEVGLLGVVADIIKVDKTYEIAIETALGGSIQNIVTDNEGTAKRMIHYLKQNKFGRATFLPLTNMSGNTGIRQPEVLQEKGVLGLANSLVKVEDKFKGLANHLLGRTIVVDHIDNGTALAKKYRQSLRIVTVEGELINPGGSMTGGAFKNSSNLLSRRREIKEFEKSVLLLKADMDEMQIAVEANKDARAHAYGLVEEVKHQLQQAYVVQNTSRMQVEQAVEKKAEAEKTFASIQLEGNDLEKKTSEIMVDQESIQIELETSEHLEEESNTKITVLMQELETDRLEEGKRQKEAGESNLALANMEQKYTFISENIQRIEEEIKRFEDEIKTLDMNKGNASDEILKKQEEISNLEETIENSKELFVEIGEEIEAATLRKEKLNKKHKRFIEKREELSKHMAELDKENYRLDSQKEALEVSSEKQIDYMWEEYELTYNFALELRDESLTDLNFMKKQIQQFKNEIRSLGNVNVNAIEEYKEVAERYEFLKVQHDDLIDAEATLLEIIEELDAAMRIQFRARFDEICVEFNNVFKELFGGGTGTLELMEEEDILEAGIRIIAQPPGKKLQNMMQLSGGEKALTAISLLFAIQNLKPSPFCLLDEIEAALDDSNVTRFAKYLHKLTKHTQFIVITHRRGTMTAADRLYGITMQEKGVSTLVSVNLLEDELDD